MDEERLHTVAFLDVVVGHTRLQVQHSVGIETESFEDAVDLGVLMRVVSEM